MIEVYYSSWKSAEILFIKILTNNLGAIHFVSTKNFPEN